LPLYESRKFRFDPNELARLITPKTKMIVLNSPHNPTGGILTRKELEFVAEIARSRNILVLSDEVYDEVLYEGKNESILSLPGMKERTILLAGHSKNYAMTGWRLGYGVFPKEIAAMVTKLAVNSVSSTAQFTQLAGMAALEGSHEPTKSMVAEFRRRRDYIVQRLNSMGLRCLSPEGAFYVFPSVEGTGLTSKEAADMFLQKAGVAVLDGACFGAHGNGYIRLSYANSMDNIKEGLNRMENMLKELRSSKSSSMSQDSFKQPHARPAVSMSPVSSPMEGKQSNANWEIHNPSGVRSKL